MACRRVGHCVLAGRAPARQLLATAELGGAGGRDGALFPVDLIGSTEEILERLACDPVVACTNELRVEVPYEFDKYEYEQILHDVRYTIAPKLGWAPAAVGATV